MAEIEETSEKPKESVSYNPYWSIFWGILCLNILAPVLRKFVSFPFEYLLAGTVATVLIYFTPPKPKIGFIKYFLTAQASILAFVFALWFVPEQLQKVIPAFWAYFLPTLLLFNAIYFLPPLSNNKTTRGAFWKWLLFSFTLAGFFGWALSAAS